MLRIYLDNPSTHPHRCMIAELRFLERPLEVLVRLLMKIRIKISPVVDKIPTHLDWAMGRLYLAP